jgi:hypothetical protein
MVKETIYNKLKDLNLPDIRIEVFLSELVQRWNVDFDDILVKPLGLFKRPYSKDILDIKIPKTKDKNEKWLSIYTSREGLYDVLPEGLFHQKLNVDPNRTTQDSLADYEIQKKEELDARKFFLPIEQEFYRERVFLELEERRASDLFLTERKKENFNQLVKFWQLDNSLNLEQKLTLLYLLPYCHLIVGNVQLTAMSMEMVLGKTIKINYIESIRNHRINSSGAILGEIELGCDLTLGDAFNDGIPSVRIEIGPIDKNDLAGYLTGGNEQKILEFLIGYLLPVEYDVDIRLLTKESDEEFILMDDSNVRLGYSTTL